MAEVFIEAPGDEFDMDMNGFVFADYFPCEFYQGNVFYPCCTK